MKVTVDLADWVVGMLVRKRMPEEICGSTIEDRLEFWAEDIALSMLHGEAFEQDRKADASVHRRALFEPDDDIDF